MSTLVTKYVQLGSDATVANNYVISTPVSPDGSLRISNGVVGNATEVLKITPTSINVSSDFSTKSLNVYGTSDTAIGGNIRIGTNANYGRVTVMGTGDTYNYNCLTLLNGITNNTTKGGLISGAPYTNTNSSWTALATRDNGTTRYVDLGGGGWDTPDATYIDFYTASTYDQTKNAGKKRMAIGGDGTIFTCLPGSTDNTVYPSYSCRAWVNFNGTGTVAVIGGGNVSSVTDNGTGDYTVNFTTNMPDTKYCPVNGNSRENASTNIVGHMKFYGATTGSISIRTTDSGTGSVDHDLVYVSIFR